MFYQCLENIFSTQSVLNLLMFLVQLNCGGVLGKDYAVYNKMEQQVNDCFTIW